MPQTINGIGTNYWGKKNLHAYQGQCQACHRVTTLTSYDTRLCFVVLFIPVVPLGRKRILDYCAACSRHYAMAHQEWEVANQRAQATIDAYRKNPTDPQRAEEALAARVSLRDIPGFLALAPEIERNCASDARILCILAGAYELFNRIADAERVLRLAVQAREEDDICEILADNLIRQDRPDEAEPYLLHIIDKGIPDRIDSLYQLAQAYQRKGDHEKALEYFQHVENVNPLIVNDKTFVRLKEESSKRLGTSAAVNSVQLVTRERSRATRRKALKAVAAGVILGLIAYTVLSLYQGNYREVIVANGLDHPYSIRLNGKPHQLNPRDITRISLAEGDVKLEMVDTPFPIAPETLRIKTDFLTRPFNGRVFVINPDRSALLTRTRVFYQPKNYQLPGYKGTPPQENYLVGRTLQEVDGVDYTFENPPDTLHTESKNKEVEKVVLKFAEGHADVSPAMMLLSHAEQVSEGAVLEIAQRRLLLEPGNTEFLNLLHMMMPPQQFATFLRPGLQKRPILLQWHRAYQTALNSADRQPQVAKEYDELLAKEPENKDLMYLAGRASRDIDKNYQLSAKAAAGDNPCPYGLHSLGGYHLEIGDFPRAVEHSSRALELLPRESDVRYYHKLALLAGARYPRLMELVREDQSKPFPGCIAAFAEEVQLLNLMNKRADIEGVAHRLRQRMHGFDRGWIDREVTILEAVDRYCTGNPSHYAFVRKSASEPYDRFIANLAIGDVAAAQAELANLKPNYYAQLLLFLAASKSIPDVAAKNLGAAIDLLAKGDHEDRAYASALKAPSSIPLNDLLRLRQPPAEKAVLLTALGVRHASLRGPCFNLARKLNFDRRFPHLLLKSALETTR